MVDLRRLIPTQFRLLAHPDLRHLYLAQVATVVSGGAAMIALPWFVLESGGSVFWASARFLIGYLPYMVLGLPAGATCPDRIGE